MPNDPVAARVWASAGPARVSRAPETAAANAACDALETRVGDLLDRMTLAEKIGQMAQVNGHEGSVSEELRAAVAGGRVGAILNEVHLPTANELQRIAVEESRLGIPLLMGRDVIHGFRTILPIPLGQAASFNPELARQGARMAAQEAAAAGINWSFAPMLDITRDPRWGRVAETFGEDPYLFSRFAEAMVRGLQGDDLARPGSIAACAKHFAGYGASESGRDYNTTNIPEIELRNLHLPTFRAALDAGAATFMSSFSALNGVPASANRFLLRQVLREEWGFDGFVVSDWAAISQLTIHGLAADQREAAFAAASAGVNMEMASSAYTDHLAGLVADGHLEEALLDELVCAILRVKFRLGLFDSPYTDPAALPPAASEDHLALARRSALQSLVLLENKDGVLPLSPDRLRSVAVIGPLADDPYEQLGTWVFDGDTALSRTPLHAIREFLGEGVAVHHARAMETTRSRSTAGFDEAVAAAGRADAVMVFLGEESILSGEAHSRANIDLPGNQADLVRVLADTGKPLIAVVMAGRPLTLGNIIEEVDALLFAWHPGTMGGPAIADVLFGIESPSGKLPVTFPRMVGQVPIYYAHGNTGKPATPEQFQHMDDLPVRTPQTSSGLVSAHLDAGFTPQYPFGFGLSYTRFGYSDLSLSSQAIVMGETLTVRVRVTNLGACEADEIVQLYLRDPVASVVRPVRELKGFQRIRLAGGESREVEFMLAPADLAFIGQDLREVVEPGAFHLWVGGDSRAELHARFMLLERPSSDPESP